VIKYNSIASEWEWGIIKNSELPGLALKGHGEFAHAADEEDAENLLIKPARENFVFVLQTAYS